MPEIARFYGIVVRMYAEAGGAHHRPHLHAYAEGKSAVLAVDEIEFLDGSISARNERLLVAWVELHQAELITNWDRLQRGERPNPIDPLR